MVNNLTEIDGIIEKIIFKNYENNFTILLLKCASNQKITVTGEFLNINSGQQLFLRGNWIQNKKYGTQFQASSYKSDFPKNIAGIKKYLSSGFIKGIGKIYAEKIVEKFKENTLQIIDTNPEQLNLIEGIGNKRLTQIITSWNDQKHIANIMVFLKEKEISSFYAHKIYKKYGINSIKIIETNPYKISTDISGIGFKTADKIAQNIGYKNNSIERIKAGILFTINEVAKKNGDCAIELTQLEQYCFKLLTLDLNLHISEFKQSCNELASEKKIIKIENNNLTFLSTSVLYYSELNCANKIKKILNSKLSVTNNIDSKIRTELNSLKNIKLEETQKNAIIESFKNKISIITGGPGTGKTTIIKIILNLLEKENISYKLASPTGRAAKRINETTGKPALTIHRLLEFDQSIMKFKKNENNKLETDFLIIDEASMIDIFMANCIFNALSEKTTLIFIGDIDQLPSVGPGNFLSDLINCKKITITKLTHVFRQSNNSSIIENAHRINSNEFPLTNIENCKNDFILIKENSTENCFNIIKTVFSKILKNYNITNEKTIVLTPMNRGTIGTEQLNNKLQEFLNTQNNLQIPYFGKIFKINDPVIQIKNNYTKIVFNGDIGKIININFEEKFLIVAFDEKKIEYSFDELNELNLAYSITIHKSQGSEYDAVIIPIFLQHFTLLQKNLIYTAVTRAKKCCILIYEPKALAIGIKNNNIQKRISFLKNMLNETLNIQ